MSGATQKYDKSPPWLPKGHKVCANCGGRGGFEDCDGVSANEDGSSRSVGVTFDACSECSGAGCVPIKRRRAPTPEPPK